MLSTTQREVKSYYNGKNDLNKFTSDQLEAIKKNLKCIALSFGTYGMNGGLFMDNNGNYYIIPSRSTRLFQLC